MEEEDPSEVLLVVTNKTPNRLEKLKLLTLYKT